MKKIIALFFALIFALAALVAFFIATTDVADIKAAALDKASKATGRTVVLDGDAALSFFPYPAVRLSDVRVIDNDGGDFFTARRLDVRISWRSLLGGAHEIDRLFVKGGVLRLRSMVPGDDEGDMDASSSGQSTPGQRSSRQSTPGQRAARQSTPEQHATTGQGDMDASASGQRAMTGAGASLSKTPLSDSGDVSGDVRPTRAPIDPSPPATDADVLFLRDIVVDDSRIIFCDRADHCHRLDITHSRWKSDISTSSPVPIALHGQGEVSYRGWKGIARISASHRGRDMHWRGWFGIDDALEVTMTGSVPEGDFNRWHAGVKIVTTNGLAFSRMLSARLGIADLSAFLHPDQGAKNQESFLAAVLRAREKGIAVTDLRLRSPVLSGEGSVDMDVADGAIAAIRGQVDFHPVDAFDLWQKWQNVASTQNKGGTAPPSLTKITEFESMKLENGGSGGKGGWADTSFPHMTLAFTVPAVRWSERSVFDVSGTLHHEKGRHEGNHDKGHRDKDHHEKGGHDKGHHEGNHEKGRHEGNHEKAHHEKGNWKIDGLKADVAGSTVSFSGKVEKNRLDGTLRLDSKNSRAIVDWAGIDTAVPPGKPVHVEMRINAGVNDIEIRQAWANMDGHIWQMAADFVPEMPLRMGLVVRADTLNLDTVRGWMADARPVDAVTLENITDGPSLRFSPALRVHMRAHLGRVIIGGQKAEDIDVQASLEDGVMTVRSLDFIVGQGIKGRIHGRLAAIDKQSGIDLTMQFDSPSVKSWVMGDWMADDWASFVDISSDQPVQGKVTIAGGTDIWTATSRIAVGRDVVVVNADRHAGHGVRGTSFSGTARMRLDAGILMPAVKGKGVRLAGKWQMRDNLFIVRDVAGSWNKGAFSGHGRMDYALERPLIKADLRFADTDLSVFLSPDKTIPPRAGRSRAKPNASGSDGGVWKYWPKIDAALTLSGTRLVYDHWKALDWGAQLHLDHDRIHLRDFLAGINDGKIRLSATAERKPKTFTMQGAIQSMQAGKLLDTPLISLKNSRIDMDFDVHSQGDDGVALRRGLSGTGNFALTGDVNAQKALAGAGFFLGGANPLQTLSEAIIGVLPGISKQRASSTIVGTIAMDRGLVRSDDLRLVSAIANAHGHASLSLVSEAVHTGVDIYFTQDEDRPIRIKTEGTLGDPFARVRVRRVNKTPPVLPPPEAATPPTIFYPATDGDAPRAKDPRVKNPPIKDPRAKNPRAPTRPSPGQKKSPALSAPARIIDRILTELPF